MLNSFLRGADMARDLRKPASVVPGLPAAPTAAKPNRAATTTNLFAPRDTETPSNQPSVKMTRMEGGGVAVEIRRETRFAALLDDADLVGLKSLAQRMKERAVAQSQGTLSLRDLRRRGHPYGRNASGLQRGKIGRQYARGVRGAVPSLSIVNRQSGVFARSWKASVERDESGVVVRLENDASVSAFLAFGTKKLAAHGPFTNVPAAFQSQLNGEWQRVIYRAIRRKQIENDAAITLGI